MTRQVLINNLQLVPGTLLTVPQSEHLPRTLRPLSGGFVGALTLRSRLLVLSNKLQNKKGNG